MEAPTYLKPLRIFQSTGIKLSGLLIDSDGISLHALSSMLNTEVSLSPAILYTIPTNQNPTDLTMPAGHRRALLALCTGKRRLPIIEGGAYHKLCYDTEAPLPLKAINQSGRAPYLGSTSKNACAGAAHRLGHCTEPIIQRQSNIKMQADYSASSISQ